MEIDILQAKLKMVLSPKRCIHSINVMETSVGLARKYGGDTGAAALAGLLHDCARDLNGEELLECCSKYGIMTDEITRKQPELLHGQVGAFLARDLYGVSDADVLEAISAHTMGTRDMSLLGRIVFVADYIEPARAYPGVEAIRAAAGESLGRAMIAGIDNTIGYLLQKGALIHPDTLSTRNWVILNFQQRG